MPPSPLTIHDSRLTLVADQLTIARGERVIQTGLSFAVAGGEAMLLTGPNGAGKTTLLRTVGGLLRPAAGTIRLDGGDPEHTLAEQCHCVGHLNSSKSSLTVGENLAFWAKYLGGPEPGIDRALAALDLVALRDIPVAYLSAGQKRRVGLARLLTAQRPLWLLDEPTVSLDAGSAAALVRLIEAHLAGGGLAVVATHAPIMLVRSRELRLATVAGHSAEVA